MMAPHFQKMSIDSGSGGSEKSGVRQGSHSLVENTDVQAAPMRHCRMAASQSHRGNCATHPSVGVGVSGLAECHSTTGVSRVKIFCISTDFLTPIPECSVSRVIMYNQVFKLALRFTDAL